MSFIIKKHDIKQKYNGIERCQFTRLKCRDFHTLYNEPPISLVKISSNPHPLPLWSSVWTQGGTEQKEFFNLPYLTMLSQ